MHEVARVRTTLAGYVFLVLATSAADFTNGVPKGERALFLTTNGVTMAIREESKWKPREKPGFVELLSGAIRVFARNERSSEVRTPVANAASINTEYEVNVKGGLMVVSVREGLLSLQKLDNTNDFILVRSGETAIAETSSDGKVSFVTNRSNPILTLRARNDVQWWLYYPAILDIDELRFSGEEKIIYSRSIEAWQSGNLKKAWREFPKNRDLSTDAELLFYASLRIAAGETSEAESALDKVQSLHTIANGLRELIAVTKRSTYRNPVPDGSPTAWLARSFSLQGTANNGEVIREAKAAALKAVSLAPANGFALGRLAELEFSSGELILAELHLMEALKQSPEYALGYAMLGFIAAAQNQKFQARRNFEHALSLDGMVPEAWLGQGLIAFRSGDTDGGIRDIQMATVLAGNRAFYRSYLGKAFADSYDRYHAKIQWEAARSLDPNDPTPFLYSALDRYANGEINAAIVDLEESIRLSDNRSVYRSRILLYEDRAVRSASLARLYSRAGLEDVALRGAATAVVSDYSDPSAHLYLADTFNALRDPTRFNLKYETAWFNEWLLANALMPVDSGAFSPNLTHLEYTRLFARDGAFLSSSGEARSDGTFRQLATQGGVFGKSAYAVDLDWEHRDGVRQNNDLDRTEGYVQVKHQLRTDDTILFVAKFEDYGSGDNFQYANPLDPKNGLHPDYRFTERQSPLAVGILRHDWSPGVQTLALAGRLENQQRFLDRTKIDVWEDGGIATPLEFSVDYSGRFESYIGELSQIFRGYRNTFVGGGRFQSGTFITTDTIKGSPGLAKLFGDVGGGGLFQDVTVTEPMTRETVYAYDTIEIVDKCFVTGGLGIEGLEAPSNFRNVPIDGGHYWKLRVLPKGSLVWEAGESLNCRAMYAQSLGGVSFDESFRLEPVQLAGFSQSFRSVIPESIVGSVSGHDIETFGAAVDWRCTPDIFLLVQGRKTGSSVNRNIGYMQLDPIGPDQRGRIFQTIENLDYVENELEGSALKLVGPSLSVGVRYKFAQAELKQMRLDFPDVPAEQSSWHSVRLHMVWNGRDRIFCRCAGTWNHSLEALPEGVDHFQVDLEFGWRLPKQRGEVSFGSLNVLNSDYNYSPLHPLSDLPNERVYFLRLRLNLR